MNSENNGLKFIRDNKLEARAILVTSRADEEMIRLACSTCCIKLLPKAMVSSLPILTSTKIKPDAVLVEDDEMVISTWLHSAKRYNRDVRAYVNREELLRHVERFDLDSKFYLDSRLPGDRGESIAKVLFDMGFKNLFLATGNTDLDKEVFAYIQGVVSKTPPWIRSEKDIQS